MDQRKIVGVGNIYANEALFAARDRPVEAGFRLSSHGITTLFKHTRRILQAAIDSQGTTFRDYRTGTGEKGQLPARAPRVRPRGREVQGLRHPPGPHPRDRRPRHRLLPPMPAVARGPTLALASADLERLRVRVRALAENRPGVYRMLVGDRPDPLRRQGEEDPDPAPLLLPGRQPREGRAHSAGGARHQVGLRAERVRGAAGRTAPHPAASPALQRPDESHPPRTAHQDQRRCGTTGVRRQRRDGRRPRSPTVPSTRWAGCSMRCGCSTTCSACATVPRRCRSSTPPRVTSSTRRVMPPACGTSSAPAPDPVPAS